MISTNIAYNKRNNVIYTDNDVYECIKNAPDVIIVEAQGQPPICLRVVNFETGGDKNDKT